MLLELIKYALPSSFWNVVSSPVPPLTIPGKSVLLELLRDSDERCARVLERDGPDPHG